MAVSHVIVGLGNPGGDYEGTRHNVGFEVLDRLAEKLGCGPIRDRKYGALAARGRLGEAELLLVKPQGYMNLSGEPTRKAWLDAGLPDDEMKERLIVVHDELDLPVGKLKLQTDRGPGGHNGVRSIIQTLGKQSFARVRVGVDKPQRGKEGADWVLSRFSKAERAQIDEVVVQAVEAIEKIVTAGLHKAVSQMK